MDKETIYNDISSQAEGLLQDELPPHTHVCNLLALLKDKLGLFWAGIYMRDGNELILGPYQGMLPCTKIEIGKGVCGTAAATKEIQQVDDVRVIENYIACHEEARSELVIPGIGKDGEVVFVLDLDHTEVGWFNEVDAEYLNRYAQLLLPFIEMMKA